MINVVNSYFHQCAKRNRNITVVDTVFTLRLFSTRAGDRLNQYFSNKGLDNVHLNRAGISRLAKHLKYVSHNGTPN